MSHKLNLFHTGNPSRFTCVCGGEPTPKISWYFNRVKIDLDMASPKDSDISIENFGHTSILVIKFTDSATTGKYMCSALNDHGLVESDEVELQIACELILYPGMYYIEACCLLY